MQLVLTPELITGAYSQGLFPMAYSAHSPYVHWICPEMRGQLPIEHLHIPKRLEKTLRHAPFEIRINTAFAEVIAACAAKTPNRPESWINESIAKVFIQLHERGAAHSLECWKDNQLIGGIYGLAIGGVFFGESMFSRQRDASKIALVHLTARLWKGRFTVFDTQFINDHLKQFGAYEMPYAEFKKLLESEVRKEADFILKGLEQSEILEEYSSRHCER